MFEAINALLSSKNLDELRANVQAHAGVLFPQTADQFLEAEIAKQTDQQAIEALTFVRDLLRMCRQHGIDGAFQRLQSGAGNTSSMEEQLKTVADAIIAFVNTKNWQEARAQFDAHREVLLSDAADQVLGEFIKHAIQEGDTKVRQMLEAHRAILRACHELGPDEAFRRVQADGPPLDAQTKAIAEAIVAFVNTPNWEAARVQLEAHRDVLLSDAADRVFADFIAEADDPKMKEVLERHRVVLQVCRQVGIDEAFRRLSSDG